MKISQKEVAGILEVSVSGFKNWLSEGCPGQLGKGRYDLATIVAWARRNKPLEGGTTITHLRGTNLELKNDILRMEKLIKEGELIPRKSVLEEFQARIFLVKSGLLQLGRSLPPRLAGKEGWEMNGIIKNFVYQLLAKFSRKGGALK